MESLRVGNLGYTEIRKTIQRLLSIGGAVAIGAVVVVYNLYGEVPSAIGKMIHISTLAFVGGVIYQIVDSTVSVLRKEGGALDSLGLTRISIIVTELGLLARILMRSMGAHSTLVDYFAIRLASALLIYKVHRLVCLDRSLETFRIMLLEAFILATTVGLVWAERIDLVGYGICAMGMASGIQGFLSGEDEGLFVLDGTRIFFAVGGLLVSLAILRREEFFHLNKLEDIILTPAGFEAKKHLLKSFFNGLGPMIVPLSLFLMKLTTLLEGRA
jgi:hypothetical protein